MVVAPPEAGVSKRELMVAIAVIVLLIAFMYWVNQQERPVQRNRSRVKKQSTQEMAKNLYKRLDGRGGVNDTTMRSLRALGANRD